MPAYDARSLKSSWQNNAVTEGRRLRWADFVPPGRTCFTVTRQIGANEASPLHSHDFHEIFWIRRGRGVHTVNGEKHALGAGTFVMVRDTDEHALSSQDGSLVVTNFAFSPDTWQHVIGRYFAAHDPMHVAPAERHHHLGAAAARQAEAFATHALMGADDRFATERLLLNLLAITEARPQARGNRVPAWLHRVLLTLEDPAALAEGVQGMARTADLHPEHMAREIKRALGKRPTDLLNEARTQYAAARLLRSSDPVDQIAQECGLDNLSHFYKLFREAYGCSPVRFRRRGHEMVVAAAPIRS